MKTLLIVIGIIIAAAIFYAIKAKYKKSEPQVNNDAKPPFKYPLTTHLKQNDKLVIVKGVSYNDLKNVLIGFCKMYNNETLQAQPRLTRFSEQIFAIIFPYDIDFEIYCYFVNYLEYPMELKWKPEILAWTTVSSNDTWITEKCSGKKVMLYIPTGDTEHDNVFMTTYDNIGYKLGFALGEERQLLDNPDKRYVSPDIELTDLTNKEFEDFR